MKPIARDELLRLGDYEEIRERFRGRVIDEKKRRRVAVGENVTAVFENRDTVLLQIQEMLRTERITREASILHEMETYNQLIPGDDEVSATLMIEFSEKETRERMLTEMSGIERHVRISIDGRAFPARWDPARILAGRASAVLYLRFPLGEEGARCLREGHGASLEIAHPAYAAKADLPPVLLQCLVEDLADR